MIPLVLLALAVTVNRIGDADPLNGTIHAAGVILWVAFWGAWLTEAMELLAK